MKLSLVEWLTERYANCLTVAELKAGKDKQGWLEDAQYFCLAVAEIDRLAALERVREAAVKYRALACTTLTYENRNIVVEEFESALAAANEGK